MKKSLKITLIASALALIFAAGSITAVSAYRNSPSYRLSVAERYLSELNYEQAIIEFEKILEIKPNNADIWLKLAEAYEKNGQLDKAKETLERALAYIDDQSVRNKIAEIDLKLNPPATTTAIITTVPEITTTPVTTTTPEITTTSETMVVSDSQNPDFRLEELEKVTEVGVYVWEADDILYVSLAGLELENAYIHHNSNIQPSGLVYEWGIKFNNYKIAISRFDFGGNDTYDKPLLLDDMQKTIWVQDGVTSKALAFIKCYCTESVMSFEIPLDENIVGLEDDEEIKQYKQAISIFKNSSTADVSIFLGGLSTFSETVSVVSFD